MLTITATRRAGAMSATPPGPVLDRDPTEDAPLAVVAGLARQWGITTGSGHTAVWAELDPPPS